MKAAGAAAVRQPPVTRPGLRNAKGLSGVEPTVSTPKKLFLTAAFISFVASVSLFFTGDHERGIFVGIWVPSILSAGTLLLGGNGHD